jgi:hypothetical protein
VSLFKNPKPVRYVIAGFIILALVFFAYEAKASQTSFEGGVAFTSIIISGRGPNIILTEKWDKWVLGMGLIGEQVDKWDRDIKNNMFVFGERRVCGPEYLKNLCLGMGLGYFQHTTPSMGSKLNFQLSVEYKFEHKGILPDYFVFRHLSNGGTSPPNAGQNMFNVGYRF